jgi:hypothetical protein
MKEGLFVTLHDVFNTGSIRFQRYGWSQDHLLKFLTSIYEMRLSCGKSLFHPTNSLDWKYENEAYEQTIAGLYASIFIPQSAFD